MRKRHYFSIAVLFILLIGQLACAPSSSMNSGTNASPLKVVVVEVVDPMPPAENTSSDAGKHLVGVHIVIENQSGDSQIITPYGVTLVDDGGFVYEANDTYTSPTNPTLHITDIRPGERIEGWVFFAVKDGALPVTLKISDALTGAIRGSTDFAASPDLEWSLLTAPDGLPGLNEPSAFKGYSMTVLQLLDPAPIGEFFEFSRPETRLVAIEIIMRNESGSEPLTVSPARLHLIDDHGFVYAASWSASSLDEIPIVDLATGEATQGYVSFEVPEVYAPSYVRFAPDWIDDTEGMTVVLR